MNELSQEQQQRLQELEQAMEQAVFDEPVPTAEALGAQLGERLIESAAQQMTDRPVDEIRQSAAAFAAQQQAEAAQVAPDTDVPVTPAELARLIHESREMILSQSARDYIQSQIQAIEAEMRELRLSGITVTPQEIDQIMQRAIQERRDPADVFRQYAYERMKHRFVYGHVDDPNPSGFFRQTGNHQPSEPVSGYQAPEWMRRWLDRNQRQPENPLRAPDQVEPPDFELYLREYMGQRR